MIESILEVKMKEIEIVYFVKAPNVNAVEKNMKNGCSLQNRKERMGVIKI